MTKIIWLLAAVLATVSARAAETYDYPYKNADVASLTAFIMKAQAKDPTYKTMEVSSIAGRDKTFLVEGRGNFKFHFYPQNKSAPLIFVIADIGGSSVSGYMLYESELLQQNGYNVITISSPFFWNFIISSSQTGLPGITDEDARDMYRSMQLALEKVKVEHKQEITKIGVLGLGLGGLDAAHISVLDKREKKLNISRYLLINPVVNLLESITEFEHRAALSKAMNPSRVQQIKEKAFNFAYEALTSKSNINDPEYFLNLDKKFVLAENEYKFLSGGLLHMGIGDTIFASQLVNDRGVLKSRLDRWHWDSRHDEVDAMGFDGYLSQLIVPEFSKKYPKLIDIAKHANFNIVRQDIIENENVFLMHNADDFLVTADQLDYLKNIFGQARTRIYPAGGHLGNLWFAPNKADVLNVFSVLK